MDSSAKNFKAGVCTDVVQGYQNDGIHSPSFCVTSDSSTRITLEDVKGRKLEEPVGKIAVFHGTEARVSSHDAGAELSSAGRSTLILSESGSCVARDREGKPPGALREVKANIPETNIQDLPDECLIRVLLCLGPVNFWKEENLDHGINEVVVRNPLQCAVVCKRWCAIADLAVDSLRLHARVDIPHLLKAFARWRCLERLDLGTTHDGPEDRTAIQTYKDLKTVLQSASSILPFLRDLRFEDLSDHDLPDICMQACSLPHLTALELGCRRLPPLNGRSSEILHTLKLTYHILEEPQLEERLGLFTRLESLSIVADKLISLPTSISQLSLLTRLDLECWALEDIPSSIAHLTGLRYLRVSNYKNLNACPQSLWDLRALRTMIWECTSDSLPFNLHHLTRLTDLRVARFDCFEGLPETVGDLQHLVELELFRGATSLSELPSSLANVTSLEVLRIKSCRSLLRLPSGIGAMVSLREVELYNCGDGMVSLPETLGRLNKLEIFKLSKLPSLVSIPEGLGECSRLTILRISECRSLRNLPQDFGRLSLLREMSITACPFLISLPLNLGSLPMLQSFRIWNCPSLAEWPGALRGLTTLEKLHIGYCASLVSLPEGLGALRKLQSMKITRCPLTELPEEIGNLSTLESLEISRCSGLLSLPPHIAPRILDIYKCTSLVSLPPSLGSQSLKIHKCFSLREFPSSSDQQAPALEEIVLHTLPIVSLSPSLGSLTSLKSLVLISCPCVTGLPESLGKLRSLEKLNLENCSSLASLPESLGLLAKLAIMVVILCPLRELPESVSQLTSLHTLQLHHCPLMSLPRSLGGLSNLRHISSL